MTERRIRLVATGSATKERLFNGVIAQIFRPQGCVVSTP